MAIDVFDLIFIEILKISPTLVAKYSTVSDQLVYLIVLPHAVLFLFLAAFAGGVVERIVGRNLMFETMFGIVGYFFIIYSGWYGTWLVPLLISWFYILIFLSMGAFLLSVVIHPSRTPALANMAKAVGKSIAGGNEQQQAAIKELEMLQSELRVLQRQQAGYHAHSEEWIFAEKQKQLLLREIAKKKKEAGA